MVCGMHKVVNEIANEDLAHQAAAPGAMRGVDQHHA
jgi:hypothetical protein